MRAWAYRLSLVFVFTVPWETAVVSGLGTLSRTAGLALAAFWLLAVLYSGHFRKIGLLHVLAVLFLLWTGCSVFWTADVAMTFERFISTLQMVVLLVILWDLYTTPSAVRSGLQAYVLGAYVIEALLIFSFLENPDIGRYQALSTTSNGTGVILAIGIPLAWELAASARGAIKGQVLRILNYAYVPLAVFCIALTATRFVMIMAVPGMLFGVATLGRLKPAWRLAVFIAICGTLLWFPTIIPERSLERLGTVDEEIMSGDLNRRTIFWQEGIDLWKEHPLTGIGAATFERVSPSGRSAHNSFVAILAELGLVGLLLYGLIWATVVFQAWNQPRWESRLWMTVLAVLFVANNALTMAHSKQSWLFFGLLAASWSASRVRGESETPPDVSAVSMSDPAQRAST